MSNEEIRNNLLAVASKLEEIELHGMLNMTNMVGCIQFVRNLADKVMETNKAEEAEE